MVTHSRLPPGRASVGELVAIDGRIAVVVADFERRIYASLIDAAEWADVSHGQLTAAISPERIYFPEPLGRHLVANAHLLDGARPVRSKYRIER